ncbi:Phosphotransferase enzyme family protein [compost metagenome]
MLHIITKKPWTLNGITKKMAQFHSDIHSKVVSDLPNQKEFLKVNILEAPLLSTGEKECTINYLESLKEGNRLCHGDFHPDNIIIGSKDFTLDWMTGMMGNPVGDVARTTLLLKMGTMPEETPKIMVYIVSQIRNQLLKKYLKHYKTISTIESKEVEDWILPVAAARLNEWIPEQEKQALVQLVRQRLVSKST